MLVFNYISLSDISQFSIVCSKNDVHWQKRGLSLSCFCGGSKTIMRGKLFQRCKHLLYCSVLSLGDNVNIRDVEVWQWNILVMGNYYVNYQSYQNLMLLTSSDTKRTLRHLFLFTNSAQRELVSICTAINSPCIIFIILQVD